MALAREQIERLRATLSTEKKFQSDGNTLMTVFSDLNTYLVNGSLSMTSLLTMVKSIAAAPLAGSTWIGRVQDQMRFPGMDTSNGTPVDFKADVSAPDIQFENSATEWVKSTRDSIPSMSSKMINEASKVTEPMSDLIKLDNPAELEALNMVNIGSKFSRFLAGASQVVISLGMGYIAAQVIMFAIQHYDNPDLVLNFSGNVAGQLVAGMTPYVVAEAIGSEFLLLVAGDAILRAALGIPSQVENEEKARLEMDMTMKLRDIQAGLIERQRHLHSSSYEYVVLGWMIENTRNIYDRVTPGPPPPTPEQTLDAMLHGLSYMLTGRDSIWAGVSAISKYAGEYRFWVGSHLFQVSRKSDPADYNKGTGPVMWEEIPFLLVVPQSGYIPVPQKRFDRGQIPPARARELNLFLASCDNLAAKLDGWGFTWNLRKADFSRYGVVYSRQEKVNKRYRSFERIFRAVYPDFDQYFNRPFFPLNPAARWEEQKTDYDEMR